jgi:alanine racemase
MLHLLDSIGMWRYPGMQFDAVRDAAFVIGHTFPDYARPDRMRFALSFKTRVVHVQWVEAGECMGYDADHPLKQRARVATLCVGYGDGYPRAMSHRGQVELHGRRAPVVGVVCMDLTMIDVTDIPETAVGDEVTLLGGGISIESYAAFSEGYKNEYITIISRRVPRVYLQGGQVIDVEEYLGYA